MINAKDEDKFNTILKKATNLQLMLLLRIIVDVVHVRLAHSDKSKQKEAKEK